MGSKAPESPTPSQLAAVRESLGLTQVQAAGLLYRTARNWQQWELGERAMDPALWELFSIKAVGYRRSACKSKQL